MITLVLREVTAKSKAGSASTGLCLADTNPWWFAVFPKALSFPVSGQGASTASGVQLAAGW